MLGGIGEERRLCRLGFCERRGVKGGFLLRGVVNWVFELGMDGRGSGYLSFRKYNSLSLYQLLQIHSSLTTTST